MRVLDFDAESSFLVVKLQLPVQTALGHAQVKGPLDGPDRRLTDLLETDLPFLLVGSQLCLQISEHRGCVIKNIILKIA